MSTLSRKSLVTHVWTMREVKRLHRTSVERPKLSLKKYISPHFGQYCTKAVGKLSSILRGTV